MQEFRRVPRTLLKSSPQILKLSKSPITLGKLARKVRYQPFESRTKHIRKLSLSPSLCLENFDLYLLTCAAGVRRGGFFFSRNDTRGIPPTSSDTEREKKGREVAKFSRRKRVVSARDDSVLSSNTSCLPRCWTGRGVLVSPRFPPPDQGMVRWGEFPGGDDLSGKHARVDTAQPRTSPSPRSASAFRPATRMEPSLFQVIERMNKDRLGYMLTRHATYVYPLWLQSCNYIEGPSLKEKRDDIPERLQHMFYAGYPRQL